MRRVVSHARTRVSVGRDLFGAWIVELYYGRVGTAGRVRQLAFDTQDAARAEIGRRLKRRASAPQRISAHYQVMARTGDDWLRGEHT